MVVDGSGSAAAPAGMSGPAAAGGRPRPRAETRVNPPGALPRLGARGRAPPRGIRAGGTGPPQPAMRARRPGPIRGRGTTDRYRGGDRGPAVAQPQTGTDPNGNRYRSGYSSGFGVHCGYSFGSHRRGIQYLPDAATP